MSYVQKAKDKALSLVGQGYIYGAKGQICSLKFRQGQAAQYPEYEDMIMGTGAKWDGIPVWDCAQFTRAVAKEAGISLVSGATSQWNKTDWDEKGTIDTLPAGEFVFLYRRQNGSSTVMQHTGVAIGDGTCIHARGTAYGVVRQNMSQYAWTHWARPKWPDEENHEEFETEDGAMKATVVGGTQNLRSGMSTSSDRIGQIPAGKEVDVLERGDKWSKVSYGGKVGYVMTEYLSFNTEESETSWKITIECATSDERDLVLKYLHSAKIS